MQDFEKALIDEIHKSFLRHVKKADFVTHHYTDTRRVPQEFIERAWVNVDWGSVLAKVTENLETRICSTIIGSLETEIKTDVKKLMSVSGFREKLRLNVYPALMKVLDAE